MRASRIIAPIFGLLIFAAASLAFANPPALSVGEMRRRADPAIGFSYWWGGSTWDPASRAWPGGCRGNCGNCTHYPSRTRNGARENGPEWGADCSGFAGKIWVLVERLRDVKAAYHPYVARNWTSALSGKWSMVGNADTRAGDMRATRSHIYFVYDRAPNGVVSSAEAVGCAAGIKRGRRSITDRFVTSRRLNIGDDTPDGPAGATDLRGPTSGEVGQGLNYCAQARDTNAPRVGLEFHFDGGAGPQVQRTRPSRGGTQMCVTHSFSQEGTYRVWARSFTEEGGQITHGARSQVLEVTIGGEGSGTGWRSPTPRRPTGSEAGEPCKPDFEWQAVTVPILRNLPIRYDLEVFDGDPNNGGSRVLQQKVNPGQNARVSRGTVTFKPSQDFEQGKEYSWHLRACLWGLCTKWSSNGGGYQKFRCGEDPCALGDWDPPASCEGVLSSGTFDCVRNSDCGGGGVCLTTLRGARCTTACTPGRGGCGGGEECASAFGPGGDAVCDKPDQGEKACFCDIVDALPQNCDVDGSGGVGAGGAVTNVPPPQSFVRVYDCD